MSADAPLARSVIPEQYLNELIDIRDRLTNSAWRIGDITNAIYEMALAQGIEVNGETVTKLQVCALVANIIGKAGRTVRGYSATSAFFPKEIRTKYEVLPFSHFNFAMRYPGTDEKSGVPIWQSILEMSMTYFENKGLPPSVDMLNSMSVDGAGVVDLPSPANREALDPGPDWVQPFEFEEVTYPDYLMPPHPDASPDPEGDNAERAKSVLRRSVGPTLFRIENSLGPIANALETLEKAPELSWLAKEIAEVSVRLKRIVESIREVAGEETDHVYIQEEYRDPA